MATYTVRIPDDLDREIDEMAARTRVSKAELTRRALVLLVERGRLAARIEDRLAALEADVAAQGELIAELKRAVGRGA